MFKVEETFGRFVLAILLPGALIWTILLIAALLDPGVVCNIPGAMCCYICGILFWLSVVPGAGSLAFPVLFAPGYLIVRAVAGRIANWRPFYWIIGWGIAGLIAIVLIEVLHLIADWKFISLNINNNILSEEIFGLEIFATLFVFFGLLCGTCYWMMMPKLKAPNRQDSRNESNALRGRDREGRGQLFRLCAGLAGCVATEQPSPKSKPSFGKRSASTSTASGPTASLSPLLAASPNISRHRNDFPARFTNER